MSLISKNMVSFSCYGMLMVMVNVNKVNGNYRYSMVASSMTNMDVDLSHKTPSIAGPGPSNIKNVLCCMFTADLLHFPPLYQEWLIKD